MKRNLAVLATLLGMVLLALVGCGPRDIGTPDRQKIEKETAEFLHDSFCNGRVSCASYKFSDFKVISYKVGKQDERLDAGIKQQFKPVAVSASMTAELKKVTNSGPIHQSLHHKASPTVTLECFFYIDRQGKPQTKLNPESVQYQENTLVDKNDTRLGGR